MNLPNFLDPFQAYDLYYSGTGDAYLHKSAQEKMHKKKCKKILPIVVYNILYEKENQSRKA